MLVQEGADIFDSSYPYLVTERKSALIFPTSNDNKLTDHQEKKIKLSEEDMEENSYEMSLSDKSHFQNKQPLLNSCKCYTCQNFTCSYIHHLINVNELLGSVLLMIHNLYHWNEFFKNIQECIQTDTIEDYIQQIKKFCPKSDS